MSEPRGPVYLTLPREVLVRRGDRAAPRQRAPARRDARGAVAGRDRAGRRSDRRRAVSADPHVGARALAGGVCGACGAGRGIRAAGGAERAERPQPADRSSDVSRLRSRSRCCRAPTSSLVLDAPVPWVPQAATPGRDAKVIHISPDPLETQYPFREFEADLLITGTTRGALPLLRESLRGEHQGATDIATRRKAIAALREEHARGAAPQAASRPRRGRRSRPRYIAACLNELKSEDAIIVNELGVPISQLELTKPRQLYGQPARRRSRLRPRRGAGRQARRARARGDLRRRRRLLHVRQSAAVPLCRPRREPADPDHHRQQSILARGAGVDARRLSRRPRRQGQRRCR